MNSKYSNKRFIKKNLYSKHLNEERSLRIYLPPGYNELVSYPIIYAQDGQDIFMFGRIGTIANHLILEEGMEPFIVVGVDVSKKMRNSEYFTTGTRNQAYKFFFVEELIPYVESMYETRNTGLKRLLIGDSLGATVSLELSIEYPQVFPSVLSLSGAFFEPTITLIEQQTDLSWLQLWMIVGEQETEVETNRGTFNFLKINRKARDVLQKKGVHLEYDEQEGKHIWGFWQNVLSNGLSYFLKKKF